MAGGLGTRLAPFTNVLPKPLIPVGDRTVIEIIIDQLQQFGLDQFILSINYKSKIIKSFFEEFAPPYSVSFLEEKEQRGTAGSLRDLYLPLDAKFDRDQLRYSHSGRPHRPSRVS